MTKNIKLFAGQKFNKLTVIKLDHIEDKIFNSSNYKSGKRVLHLEYYLCKCDCGKETIVEKSHLRKNVNATKSCGCSMGTHHMSHKNRIYNIWTGIRRRCLSSKQSNIDYKNYKGRGITICEEWKNDFKTFYDWAIANGYKDDLTIDRINNNGNYEPSNCRWATKAEQTLNYRRNRKLLFNGKILTIKEISDLLKMKYNTLYMKIRRNGDGILSLFEQTK